jgi:hypothetical protein
LRPGAGPQRQQRQAGQWQSWGMLKVETACLAGLLLMININGFFTFFIVKHFQSLTVSDY